jgi:hypothetical protein
MGAAARFRPPTQGVASDDLAVPQVARPGEIGFDEKAGRLLAMPLDRFEAEGNPLEMRVPWLSETLWLVPTEREADALAREGIGRGRVWTARELIQLMMLRDRTPEVVRAIALAKIAFAGDITAVTSLSRTAPHRAGAGENGSATSRKSNFRKSRSTVYSRRTPCCRSRAARWASGTRLPRTGK